MLQRCRLLLARSGKFECDAHVIIQPAEDVRLHIGIIFRGDQDPGCDGADTPQEESAQKPHTQHGPQNEAYMADQERVMMHGHQEGQEQRLPPRGVCSRTERRREREGIRAGSARPVLERR